MEMYMRKSITTIFVSLLFISPAFSDEASDIKDVWELEHNYWEYVKSNDIESYLSLWDNEFIGWPGLSETPQGIQNIAGWIAPLHENSSQFYDNSITHMGAQTFNNVVVVHYLNRAFRRSTEMNEIVSEITVSRVTHTWQRRGDTWQIITGMSASQVGENSLFD